MHGNLETKASESWTCNSELCGNPSTREKHMPYAYSGNLRLHLSHSLSKVYKKIKEITKSAK